MLSNFMRVNQLEGDAPREEPWNGDVGQLLSQEPGARHPPPPPTTAQASPSSFSQGNQHQQQRGSVPDLAAWGIQTGSGKTHTPPSNTRSATRTNSSGTLQRIVPKNVKESSMFPQAPPTPPPPPPVESRQQPPPPPIDPPAPPPPEDPPAPTSPAAVPPSPPMPQVPVHPTVPATLRLADYGTDKNDPECAFEERLPVAQGMIVVTDTGDLGEAEELTEATVVVKARRGYWVERPRHLVAKALLVVLDPVSVLKRPDFKSVIHMLQQYAVIATWSSGFVDNTEKDLSLLGLNAADVLFTYTKKQCTNGKKNLTTVWAEFPGWSASDTLLVEGSRDQSVQSLNVCAPSHGKKKIFKTNTNHFTSGVSR